MKKVGIIGLGIMGHGIAVNFLKNGYETVVWNRNSEKADDLVKSGAQLLKTPKEVAQFADIVFDVVSNDEASRSVWFGVDGILTGASSDKVLITSATLSLDYVDELIEATTSAKLKFLDVPLTGSRIGAETGNLQLLVGGDAETLKEIRADLDAISKKVYHFGPSGNGMRFKLMLNTLTGIHVVAAAQVAILLNKAGLNTTAVTQALQDGMPPSSPVTNLLFSSLDDPVNSTRFAVEMLEKDLRYAQKMAKKYNFDIDMLNDAQKDFAKAKEVGLGERDWSAIINIFNSSENN